MGRMLSGDGSYPRFLQLERLDHEDLYIVGATVQLAAQADMEFRRLYFGALEFMKIRPAKERASEAQVIQRLSPALRRVRPVLPDIDAGLQQIDQIAGLLKHRNEVAHGLGKRAGNEVIVFATSKENKGHNIRTGERIGYWVIERAALLQAIASLDHALNKFAPLSTEWLTQLRPHLGPKVFFWR